MDVTYKLQCLRPGTNEIVNIFITYVDKVENENGIIWKSYYKFLILDAITPFLRGGFTAKPLDFNSRLLNLIPEIL